MSAMNAYRSRLSAKYWNRLPLATPARRAMTFRLPREKPCAPNSASAASIIAARRAGSTRAQVTVGMEPPSVDDHWSSYGELRHSQVAEGASGVIGLIHRATFIHSQSSSRGFAAIKPTRIECMFEDFADAALVNAIGDSAHAENKACARRLAAIAELYWRRQIPGEDGKGRELWRIDAWEAVAAE